MIFKIMALDWAQTISMIQMDTEDTGLKLLLSGVCLTTDFFIKRKPGFKDAQNLDNISCLLS